MKRMIRLLPGIIAGTILLCSCIVVGAYAFFQNNASDQTKLKIGVVGNIESTFLQSGITALQSMDTTRYIIELISIDKEEADSMIMDGELTAYMLIPEEFTKSVSHAENEIYIDYVCGEGNDGLVGTVMEEIVESFSEYITGSQSTIYSAKDINDKVNGTRRLPREQLIDINSRCINSVLTREKLCEVENMGIGFELSGVAYYFSGIFVVFLLLVGINSCMYFSGRSREYQRISIARGQRIWQQLIGEYFPFLLLTICIILCVWVFLSYAVSSEILVFEEWTDDAVIKMKGMFLHSIPVVIFITLIQMFIYEIVDNLIGSILLQFIVSICMGYMSGCFYPEEFFTDAIRNVSNVLPPKMAMKYMASYFTGDGNLINNIGMIGYCLVCVVLIYVVRRYRIEQS